MRSFFIWTNKQSLLFVLLISFAGVLWGVEVNLYEVELPTQTGTKAFNQAKLIEQAFQNILVRVSGTDKILSVPSIIHALTETDKYVNQFSYHQRSTNERYIKVIFNESRVNQLFKHIKQPIWGKNRPLTLVWLVTERNQTPYWVGGDSEHALVQEMEKVLNDRAIPFVFPLLDLTDTTQVSEREVVNEELEPLEQAAKRYNSDVILLGRLSQKSEEWFGHWALVKEGTKITWDNSGAEVSTLLNLAAEELTAKLIGRNSEMKKSDADPKNPGRFILTVSGISSAKQYTQVLAYLRRLPGVTDVEAIEVMPEKTTFNLKTDQSKESIESSIAKGHLLVEKSRREGQAEGSLVYKVVGE